MAWFNASWEYRKEITISSADVDANLTNFPVLVSVTDTDFQEARSDGFDFVFTEDDETTQIDHEIVEWNDSTGLLVAWFEAPSLSSTVDNTFYIYYGNSGATDQQDVSGTWANDFSGVLHFGEGTGTSLSASVGPDYTINGSTGGWVTGKILNAYNWESADDATSDTTFSAPANVGAIELWYKIDTVHTGSYANRSLGVDDGWEIIWNGSQIGADIHLEGAQTAMDTNETYTAGNWYHIVYTYDTNSGWEWFVNGSSSDSGGTGDFNATSSTYSGTLYLGDSRNLSANVDGAFEGWKVHDDVRSSGWWSTTYANQDAPGDFLSFGSEETDTTTVNDDGGVV